MKRPLRRSRSDLRVLTAAQRDDLAEGVGLTLGRPSGFRSDEEEAAWAIHGARIMNEWKARLRRPRGWWLYEAGEPEPPTALAQLTRLVDLGELTAAERGVLPDSLSADSARAVVACDGFRKLPAGLRRELVGFDGLLSGLTAKGIVCFLDRLRGTVVKLVVEHQRIDLDALRREAA